MYALYIFAARDAIFSGLARIARSRPAGAEGVRSHVSPSRARGFGNDARERTIITKSGARIISFSIPRMFDTALLRIPFSKNEHYLALVSTFGKFVSKRNTERS